MSTEQTIAAINSEIQRQEQELQRLREELAAIEKAEIPADDQELLISVLSCPHTVTHESVTLHFYPRQKEGHNALAQLHHRLAAYNLAARQREMQLLGEIEALERLALNVLKQLGEEAAPQAVHPESIRDGAPYDNPEFEQLARDIGVWGTAQSAACAQFWLAAAQQAAQRSAYAAKGAKEVFCKKCEMTVISNCGSASGCPVRNIYAAQAKQGEQ